MSSEYSSGRLRITMKSLELLLLSPLCVAPFAQSASFLAAPTRTVSPVRIKNSSFQPQHPSRIKPLSMNLEPVTSFLTKQIQLDQLCHAESWKETLSLMFSQLPSLTCADVQAVGETTFAALVLIAAAQGALITHQYATNPSGELVVPPGLTVGQEDAWADARRHTEQRASHPLDRIEDIICNPTDSQATCNFKKGWYYVTKFLVFLLPLIAGQGNMAFLRYGHFMRAAVMLVLAHIYDFFRKLPDVQELQHDDLSFGENPNIVVLGDSMSVGIGCVNEFDPDKNSGILRRIEQLEPDQEDVLETTTGPVFPRVLARTLSHRLKKPVSWRSAGVDGGDTHAIRHYLMDVIEEEVAKGTPPDLVVVLTGSNDLKRILSMDPENGASIRGFRSNLMQLVRDIRAISPKTKVAFPALPTYRLDENSILNVFPLSLFLDVIIGFWDAQKIRAADHCPGVFHVDLTLEDVHAWYKEEQANGEGPSTLLAADGIHPNAKCYAKWATFVGNKLADTLLAQEPKMPTTRESPSPRPAFTGGFTIPVWGI